MSGLAHDAFAAYIEFARRPKTRREMRELHIQCGKQAVYALIERAKAARQKARSWRDFKVGCSVLAYNREYALWDHPKYGERYKAFDGWNIKLSQDAEWMVCAEEMAITAAISAGYSMIILVVVCGEFQADDKTGVSGTTLRPCTKCRKIMRAVPIIHNRTRIVTIRPDESEHEVFTRHELTVLFREHVRT